MSLLFSYQNILTIVSLPSPKRKKEEKTITLTSNKIHNHKQRSSFFDASNFISHDGIVTKVDLLASSDSIGSGDYP